MGRSQRSKKHPRRGCPKRHYEDEDENTEENSDSDIPGYYYDKEKKKYFKILPNSMSSVGSFVTKENINKNKDENRRLLDRERAIKGNDKSSLGASSPSSSQAKKAAESFLSKPLLDVLSAMQCGQYTCQSVQRYTMRHRCQKLRPQPGWEQEQNAIIARPNLSLGEIQRVEVSANYDKAVTVWSQKDIMLQWMQLVTLTAKRKQNSSSVGSHLNLSISDTGFNGRSFNKVTGLCWSPLSHHPDKTCVLYTTVCPVGYGGSNVSIFNLEAPLGEYAHMFSFNLGRHPVWSCAWNKQQSRFSVGKERKCMVIDIHTRCQWTYNTLNSDNLTQLFSPTTPNLLYAGTRNGYVLTLDLRAPHMNQNSAVKFNHEKSVVCLRALNDENYLMASDFSGVIRTWDFRFRKTVKSYSDMVNSHYQIPFYIDETEKFVYGTGSDGYCKIWDLKDGILLKSIAPPLSLHSAESFPVSHLSEKWGNLSGNFGLVTAMANRFFLHS